MTSEELRAKLERIGPSGLAAFLVRQAEEENGLRERIEALGLREDRAGYASALERRLKRFRSGRSFISYRESGEFARELEAWLDDVETGLLDRALEVTWTLLDRFIRTDERILGRADDSNGSIGDAYRRACELWLRAAAALPPGPEWLERIYELHAGDDYGTRDAILDAAATRLSELELRRLARRYEQDAQAVRPENDDYRTLSASAAMGQVARALGDAALYERSVRIHSPHPNELQAVHIAEQYLRFGPVEKAVEWLTQPEDRARRDFERLELLAQAYEKLGNPEGQLDARRRLFELSLSSERFAEYAALLPPKERDAARVQALERARRSDDPVEAGLFLLELGEPAQAAAQVLRLREELSSCFYTHLLSLAQGFEKVGHPLAAVVCYRTLTEQILDEGRSKAYRHAKRYVDRLSVLHASVGNYDGLLDHAEYVGRLRERHARKYSFWRLFPEAAR